MVRQSARGGVPRDALPRGAWDEPDYLVMDLDPPRARASTVAARAAALVRTALTDAGMNGAVKTSGAKGLHVFVPLAVGTRPEAVAAATRAIAARAERLDPELATTAFVRRSGAERCSSIRRGPAARPWSRPTVRACDRGHRVVPARLGRPRERHAGRLHHPQCNGSARRSRSLGRVAARASDAPGGPRRRGARDPHCPRPGHARGQAPRPRPARVSAAVSYERGSRISPRPRQATKRLRLAHPSDRCRQ